MTPTFFQANFIKDHWNLIIYWKKEFLACKVQSVSSPSLTRWSSNNGRRQVGLPRPLAKQIPTTLASFALSCSENPFRNRISCSKQKHHPNEPYFHILNKLFLNICQVFLKQTYNHLKVSNCCLLQNYRGWCSVNKWPFHFKTIKSIEKQYDNHYNTISGTSNTMSGMSGTR